MDDIKSKLEGLKSRFQKISASINQEDLQRQIRELEAQTMKEGFWSDQSQSSAISQQLADKQKTLESLKNLEIRIQDALEMSEEPAMEQDLKQEVGKIDQTLSQLE